MSTINYINHYKKSIEKNRSNSERLLHCLTQLFKLNGVSVKHLQETGIGKTVNSLRKHNEPNVSAAAKTLVTKWKAIVAAESDEDDGDQMVSEDNEDDGNHKSKHKESNGHPHHNSSNSLTQPSTHSSSKHSSSTKSSSDKINQDERHEDDHQKTSDEEMKIKTKHRNDKKESKHHHSQHSERHSKETSSHTQEASSSSKRKPVNSSDDDSSRKKHSKHSKDEKSLASHSQSQSHSSDNSQSHHASQSHTKKSSRSSDDSTKSHKKHNSEHGESSKGKSMKRSAENESKSSSEKHKSKKQRSEDEIEFDSANGMGFAEALAAFDDPANCKKMGQPSKKPSKKSSTSVSQPSTSSGTSERTHQSSHQKRSPDKKKSEELLSSPPNLLCNKAKLEPLPDITQEIAPELVQESVQISNNYRPLPMNSLMMDYVFSTNNKAPKKFMTDDELLEASFSSKANRTKVFSGNKTYRGDVPRLFEMCIRSLQENIDMLEYTGGVPFDVLKPVLEKASPEQLSNLEYYNPYLMEDSDILWEPHCRRKFRTQEPQEMESWRDMYLRCTNEQENKLKSLTEVIRRAKEQSETAVKKSKMAYVDTAVKAPRNIANKQRSLIMAMPPMPKMAVSRSQPVSINNSLKSRRAPLMAKSLQLMKGRMFNKR